MRDVTACDEFVRTDATSLLRLATVLTGNREDGEDLAQECLVRVVRAWDRVAPEDPHSYARTVLLNLFRDRLRQLGRRPRTVPWQERHDTAHDPLAELPTRTALLGALAQLPRQQRAVLVLRFYEGMTEDAAAKALGCSVSAVKSHSRRGLARLRHHIGEPVTATTTTRETP